MQEEDDELKTYVTSIIASEEIQINDVPCLAFILYDTKTDTFFARIFNTLTNEWDAVLEDVLHKNERVTWKEEDTI